MNFEEELFKRSHIIFDKLENYGFRKENDKYTYSKNILNDTFRIDIVIDSKGKLTGKIIDLSLDEEYTNFRVLAQTGEFVNKVRNAYQSILLDIKDKCYLEDYFISKQANMLTSYISKKYGDTPEFLWDKFKGYGVFRNKDNQKWYAAIMNIDKSKISSESGEIEIINLKLDTEEVKELLNRNGFYKAYHMNSANWISIILDDTLNDEEIITLLDKSYNNISNL